MRYVEDLIYEVDELCIEVRGHYGEKMLTGATRDDSGCPINENLCHVEGGLVVGAKHNILDLCIVPGLIHASHYPILFIWMPANSMGSYSLVGDFHDLLVSFPTPSNEILPVHSGSSSTGKCLQIYP